MARILTATLALGALTLCLAWASPGRAAKGAGPDDRSFEAWAAAVPAVGDTLATAPLPAFLWTALVSRQAGDSTGLVAASRAVLKVQKELSVAEPGSSRVWLMKAFTLAGTLCHLGATRDARHWYARVARSGDGIWRGMARQELVRVATVWNDTVTLDSMAADWGEITTEVSPAVTLCSALYVKEMHSTLLRFLDAHQTLEFAPYCAFFRGAVAFDQGAWDRAADQMTVALREVPDAFPASLRLAALSRLAEVSRRRGRRETAMARYRVLSGMKSPYVKSWAAFMLGSLSLAAGELDEAARRFAQACGDAPDMQWTVVACLMNEGLALAAEARRQRR